MKRSVDEGRIMQALILSPSLPGSCSCWFSVPDRPPRRDGIVSCRESLSEPVTCGKMIREGTGGNQSLRSKLEGRSCQSVE